MRVSILLTAATPQMEGRLKTGVVGHRIAVAVVEGDEAVGR